MKYEYCVIYCVEGERLMCTWGVWHNNYTTLCGMGTKAQINTLNRKYQVEQSAIQHMTVSQPMSWDHTNTLTGLIIAFLAQSLYIRWTHFRDKNSIHATRRSPPGGADGWARDYTFFVNTTVVSTNHISHVRNIDLCSKGWLCMQ